MKYILLAAGEGIRFIEKQKNLPKCLVKIKDKTILDNIVDIASKLNIKDIHLIGGFEILKIMQKYPSLKYHYNEKWEKTGTLYSLSKALDVLDDDIIISYTDIVYTEKSIAQLISTDKDLAIGYDSSWETRYEGRQHEMRLIEKVYRGQTQYFLTNSEMGKANLLGEYAGVVYIKKNQLFNIQNSIQMILEKDPQATILDFITGVMADPLVTCNAVDMKDNWAETDSRQDIENFKFGTKAETLHSLEHVLKKSKVLGQVTFSVEDYLKDPKEILGIIQKNINSPYLAVRSSALNEDTHLASMAGNYKSVLKVPMADFEILKKAISGVIQSYEKGGQVQNIHNQILVQPYLENVDMSGVVFTKNLQTFAPYYIINYDESSDTESVTSGRGEDLSTFICYKEFGTKVENVKLRLLINAVKEIEAVTCYDALDIEFAFTGENLYILQVRPIAAKKNMLQIPEYDFKKEIEGIKQYLERIQGGHPNLLGKESAFGIMPDWNPAEIIGVNPKKLAFDLYRYIITDTVWGESRKRLGYRDARYTPGIVSFAGKPYVDIRMSFNTFIPSGLDENVADKLVDYFINLLKEHPEEHDKVEFSIAMTSFDFNFDQKVKKLHKAGFTQEETCAIAEKYLEHTENMVLQKSVSIKQELEKLDILKERREKIISSSLSIPEKILNLLEDCKKYGTYPFAILARLGFVGSAFLRSLQQQKIVTKKQYNDFLQSVHTVAKQFIHDYHALLEGTLTKKSFIDMYGHLRPGSYDIVSLNYKKNFDHYIDLDHQVQNSSKTRNNKARIDSTMMERIKEQINEQRLGFSAEELLEFIKNAMKAREFAKFEFTKNLDLVLELVEEFTSEYGITRENAAHLDLNTILKYANNSTIANIGNELKDVIADNQQKYLLTSALQLPELIFDIKDIEMFFYPKSKPNFITQHSIGCEIAILQDHDMADIDGKIVFIENADPGFDWIFSHDIKGLVTKFGGAASHMAIRCAEFDLPAAIGCGESIYDDLLKYKKIKLDCSNQSIKGIT